MSKNSALRDLFEAIQRGDRGAVLPLADHLEELGALDLATFIREAIPEGGQHLVGAVAVAFEVCHADARRDLLRWEEEPYYRRTRALDRAVLALPLDDVPVLTEAIDLDDRDRWVRQARALFRRLGLRGLRVAPKASERYNRGGKTNPCIEVLVPRPGRVLREEEDRAGNRVIAKLQSILARAYPILGAQDLAEGALEKPFWIMGCSRRCFVIAWTDSDRWRIPWEKWATPEEVEEEARLVREVRAEAAQAEAERAEARR
jgi:hypothetical protein